MTAKPPENSERLDCLRLIRSENVGPRTYRQLLERFGTAAAALEALPDLARRGGRRGRFALCSTAEAEAELAAAAAMGARTLVAHEPDYPPALAALDDPPPIVHVMGDCTIFERPAAAIVGARNASAAGLRFARRLARELAEAGMPVVSGLARGIDTAAHEGALAAGTEAAGTVAVFAGGLDAIYPPENAALADRIAASGALLSEMPPGTEPQARHFPRRNRLIAGLTLGVVVVEAALRSGSLITARLATEQGREVFAVPGFPTDPRHEGTNRLLRDGAGFVECAEDVLETLRPMYRRQRHVDRSQPNVNQDVTPLDIDQERRIVVDLLGPTPTEIDDLIRQGKLTPAAVMTILLELELAGRLDRLAGNRVALRY